MSQTFEYPNLLKGSRSGAGWIYDKGIFFDKLRLNHCLYNNTKKENFLYSGIFHLVHGVDYTLSVLTANTANCMGSEIHILSTEIIGKDGWIAFESKDIAKGPGGWVIETFSLPAKSPEGNYQIRFDNDGSKDGEDALIWFNSPMLCIASEPHAWAPAEGEVWP